MLDDPLNILIVEARAGHAGSDALLAGAKAALAKAKTDVDVVSVPGVLEIPTVIAMAEEGGHRPAGVRYDGYVALGVVMRAGTFHFEVAAHESARGIMDLGIGKRLAIGTGFVADGKQALEGGAIDETDEGGAAARACLALIALQRRLGLKR